MEILREISIVAGLVFLTLALIAALGVLLGPLVEKALRCQFQRESNPVFWKQFWMDQRKAEAERPGFKADVPPGGP